MFFMKIVTVSGQPFLLSHLHFRQGTVLSSVRCAKGHLGEGCQEPQVRAWLT